MKKLILLLPLIGLMAVSCGNRKNTENGPENNTTDKEVPAAAVDEHTAQNSLDWAGTYEGLLPCADCPGIKTTLELKDDHTFILKETYEDRDSRFEDKGRFTWDDTGMRITLQRKGGPQYYKVREGSMLRLDEKGNEISGNLAKNYVLQKK